MNARGGSISSSESRRTYGGSSRSRERASSCKSFQPVIVDEKDFPKSGLKRRQNGESDIDRKRVEMAIAGGERLSCTQNYILMNVNLPNEDSSKNVPWSVQMTTDSDLCINFSPQNTRKGIRCSIVLVYIALVGIVALYFIQKKWFRYPYYW